MKTTSQICDMVARRLEATWHQENAPGGLSAWPHSIPLKPPTATQIARDFPAIQRWALDLRRWAAHHDLTVHDATPRVAGATRPVPKKITVPTLGHALALAGPEWEAMLRRGQQRHLRLAQEFPHCQAPGRVVRAANGYSEVDFDLLCRAAAWFITHPDCGLSPRQVPIEGLHAKWIDSHHATLRHLVGRDDLGLVGSRPWPVRFTYLDPAHRAAGGRLHDSAVPGDAVVPAYDPQVVVITENRDTAVLFPPTPGGVAVQGDGSAGPAQIARIDFLCAAPLVVYWGDLDARGLEIVNDYRARGVPVRTILMDRATALEYAPYAATTDASGKPLQPRAPGDLPHLTEVEQDVYRAITGEAGFPVRVEQERIPLEVAWREVAALR